MLTALLTRLVRGAARHAWTTIAICLLLTALSGWYAAGHFAIDTDIDRLLESNAPWAQRDAAMTLEKRVGRCQPARRR
ncbi:hypothetical protein, partial [Duganella callida]